ncbi:hypothetical protein Vretimale_8470 [Volvox reticuliferus]|uniref:Cyclic nucleotide-binding domain-containing protein n=1 Tax=Volvox reticuliferus TaxID=1737510 RepID=A0A8J4GB06_9CHLO|nr:hypothetical protein Vretimale_8470 [Volvox reticuliferus]
MSLEDAISVLICRPPQRKADEIRQLAKFLQQQPFFAGVGLSVLQEICSALTFRQASPGEVVLHVGELTDRLYLLISGSCTVVRHSRKEGFNPQPPQQLTPGQALCEAALVVSTRRSDVEVAVSARPNERCAAGGGDTGGSGSGCGSDGGAVFAVLTRGAWSNLCVRASVQPLIGQARNALLCCCARSLAASSIPHGARTLEQAEDLAALLRLLPSLCRTPEAVLRAMSESAYLRQLPPGTILFEECTRAESQFLVLAGAVEIRRRRRRLGTVSRKGTAAAAAVLDSGGKTVREKIEEERKAREALKESLSLTREGLKEPLSATTTTTTTTTPSPPAEPPTPASSSRRWMSEFISRARKVAPGPGSDETGADQNRDTAVTPAVAAPAAGGATVAVPAAKGNLSRAALAWRRAVLGVVPPAQPKTSEEAGGSGGGNGGGSGGAVASGDAAVGMGTALVDGTLDPLLAEYERLKAEEAGHVTDVGNFLGGAGSRDAYIRGIREVRSRYGYGYDMAEQPEQEQAHEDASANAANAPWRSDGGDRAVVQAESGGSDVDGPPAADPLVRLRFLDRQFQMASKVVRFGEAAEGMARLLEERSWESRATAAVEPSIQSLAKADIATPAVSSVAIVKTCYSQGLNPGSADGAALSLPLPGPVEEQLLQLYGSAVGTVDPGHIAGELPEAALCRAAGVSRAAVAASLPAPLLRRADTAIAGRSGASVLVVVLEALRRGHEAARDDLVSERLAVLTALEPLRGLSDEHQAQLALGCTVAALDAHELIVRQGQPVDALYVVLDGEVRLLDDPMEGLAAAAAAAAPLQAAGGSQAAPASVVHAATGRSISLNGGTFGRKAAALAALDAAAVPPPPPLPPPPPTPPSSSTGGHGSIRMRRALAARAVLSLMGPGGSFGESVLGYPEDVVAAAAAEALIAGEAACIAARASYGGSSGAGGGSSVNSDGEDEGDGGAAYDDGGGNVVRSAAGFALGASALGGSNRIRYDTVNGDSIRTSMNGRTSMVIMAAGSSSVFLASAVTSRPSRLLVLPRSLLVRYGYLHASLPPFASLRREAINGRRQQLQAGLQNLPGVALGLLVPPPTHGMPAPPSARWSANIPPPQRLMTPPSRPPEFLDTAIFRGLSTPRTTAVFGALNAPATAAAAGAMAAVNPRGSGGILAPPGEHADADAAIPGAGLGTGGPGGGGGGSVGSSPFPSLPLSERLKRFGTTRSGGGPSGTHWHFIDPTEAGGLVEDTVRLLGGGLTARTLRPLAEEQAAEEEGLDAATADGTLGQALPILSGGPGGGGGDALQAPPKPCALRTSLTGARQYSSTAMRSHLETRSSSSGLPPISTLIVGGAASNVGRDLLNSPTGGAGNSANQPQPQRFTSQGHLMLRGDMSSGEDTAALGLPMGTAAAAGDEESPKVPEPYGYPLLSPLQLSPTAASISSGGGAAADLASPSGSNGGPQTPTAFPSLGGGGGGGGGASWGGGSGGNLAESPQAFLASIAIASSGGGGGGGSGGSGSVSTAPLRGLLLPYGGGTLSTLTKRASYAGTSTSSLSLSGFASGSPFDSQWQRTRESAPGTPLLAQPPYSHFQSQSQLNLYSSMYSGGVSRSGSSMASTPPYNNRLLGSSGGGSRNTSQLEILLTPTSLDGAAPAAPPALAPPLPRSSFGGPPIRTTNSRQAWRDAPDIRLSWDGAAAVRNGGSGGDCSGGSNMLSQSGGARTATELALAALAANQPPDAHFLLAP